MIFYAAGAATAWAFALTIDRDWPALRAGCFAVAVLLTFLTLNAIFGGDAA
jgi:hypothetical protein